MVQMTLVEEAVSSLNILKPMAVDASTLFPWRLNWGGPHLLVELAEGSSGVKLPEWSAAHGA